VKTKNTTTTTYGMIIDNSDHMTLKPIGDSRIRIGFTEGATGKEVLFIEIGMDRFMQMANYILSVAKINLQIPEQFKD